MRRWRRRNSIPSAVCLNPRRPFVSVRPFRAAPITLFPTRAWPAVGVRPGPGDFPGAQRRSVFGELPEYNKSVHGGVTSAAGGRYGAHLPRLRRGGISLLYYACLRHEPLQMRFLRASNQSLSLFAEGYRPLYRSGIRSAARPYRHSGRSPRRFVCRHVSAGKGRGLGCDPQARLRRAGKSR